MTKKNGFQNQKQRFKCYNCNKVFISKNTISEAALWNLYTEGKQTYLQLSVFLNCSKRTVQRKIDKYKLQQELPKARAVIVLTDTTYWGRSFGVMLFKDSITGENLLKQYVEYETISLYRECFEKLIDKGFQIEAIVCDGKQGLLKMYSKIPTQMCQFHQIAIIKRYLTRKPKLQASKELWQFTKLLTKTDKESFEGGLNAWYEKWKDFLNERSQKTNKQKSAYKHKRLRSAYNSIKRNLPYLFTWYDNLHLQIPNTTNAIDGHFADLKNKLRNHNGLSLVRKKKFIDGFLKV
jgi:hypothetical protein